MKNPRGNQARNRVKLPSYKGTDFVQSLVKYFGYPEVRVNIKVSKITKYRFDKKKGILYFY